MLLAVVTSIVGIVVLWIACANHEPPVVELADVSDELLGKVVTVSGVLDSVKIYDSVVVAGFENSELILFGFKSSMPVIKVGDFVTVTGEVKEYKGELEIVPSKLEDVLVGN